MCKSTMEKRFTIYILILTGIFLGIFRSSVQATEADAPVFISSEITYGDEIYNRINGKSYQENGANSRACGLSMNLKGLQQTRHTHGSLMFRLVTDLSSSLKNS